MSKEKLLETIGQVKEEFIEEAAPKGLLANVDTVEGTVKKSGRMSKIYPYLKWGALAACLCIIVGLGMKIAPFSVAENDMAFEAVDQMKPNAESVKTDAESPFYELINKSHADYTTGENTSIQDNSVAFTEIDTVDKGFPDWGLTLSVENVTSTGLTLVVTQSGGNPTGSLETGEAYRLITLKDGTWKVVEELPLPEGVDGRGFNSIGYFIPRGETREFEINWEWIFGELPSGTYRLIKNFTDFRETANYDSADFWVEFEIK